MKRRKKLPYVIIILACIFLLIPFAATLVYSFTIGWTKLFPAGWTFKYWIQAFTEPTLWPAILRGVLISIPPILICNIVVILALYTSVVYYPKLEKYIQTICMIPNSLKGVTIAIPVLALYAGGVTFFSNRMVMLVCIYSISILPFVIRESETICTESTLPVFWKQRKSWVPENYTHLSGLFFRICWPVSWYLLFSLSPQFSEILQS